MPEAAAWCVLRAFKARASLVDGLLVLASGPQRLELPLADIAAVEPWRLPIPGPGLSLRLASGGRWRHGLALPRADAFARALGVTPARATATSAAERYARARQAPRGSRLEQPAVKFGLFPLLLAIPAFRLHQHIAYGGAFGEYLTFGLKAYLTTFALWWAAWAIGVVLCAAAVRAAIEACAFADVVLAPARATDARRVLERFGLAALYLGLPSWMAMRLLNG